MDVTRENFEQLLPSIQNDIDKATFISIDGEFTGVTSYTELTPFDTLTEYYTKFRTGSKDHLLIQLGLSIFTYDDDTKSYRNKCYNLYAFPKPHSRQAANFSFLSQTSSMIFLAEQGFDFNKLFRYGISYLTKDEESYLYEQMEEKNKLREAGNLNEQNHISVPDNDIEFVDKISKNVEEFLESEENELLLDRCNSFLRRLLYQELEARFKNKLFLETRTLENHNVVLVVQKALTPEQLAEKEAQRKEREERELKESVGLSRLIQYLSQSGKLIVGHNMLLDIMHIIKQFFGPLPEDYQDFKDLVHDLFPRIVDTKVLSNAPVFKDKINSSVLGHLLATCSEEPFKIPTIEQDNKEFGYKDNESKEHEAAYDAFITGKCFLSMVNYLKNTEDENWSFDLEVISPFINAIHLMRLHDIPYMKLNGKDVVPSRNHVFHVTFPKEWKTTDVSQLFSAYGTVQVFWLTDGTAFVALHRKENASAALKAFSKNTSTNYKVQSYYQYRGLNQGPDLNSTPKNHKVDLKTGSCLSPKEESLCKVGQKRRLPSESSSQAKEFSFKPSELDKYGPSIKVPRKGSKSESDAEKNQKSSSGVFNISDDWN